MIILSKVLNEDLLFEIYSVVEEIPLGSVATYGQIAKLIGCEKNSRLVGRALKMSSIYGDFPCHRVVNFEGRITPSWEQQRQLLEDEGVTFKDPKHVDLKKHKWNI